MELRIYAIESPLAAILGMLASMRSPSEEAQQDAVFSALRLMRTMGVVQDDTLIFKVTRRGETLQGLYAITGYDRVVMPVELAREFAVLVQDAFSQAARPVRDFCFRAIVRHGHIQDYDLHAHDDLSTVG